MTPETFLTHLRADSARIADLAPRDLDTTVPPCPGWTVRDVVVHTGAVYSHKVACMRMGTRPQDGEWQQEPPEGEDPVGWFRVRLAELLTELEQRGPDAPAYTWYDAMQSVGFWLRRMAQETVIHRVDVESAFDVITHVDDDLAIDGIDEVLDWFLLYQADDVGPDGPGRGTVAVRTGDHIWRVTLNPDDVALSREPGPSDAVVSGEPSELLLWLWGRRPDSSVGFEGDRATIDALRERLRVVTQ